MYNSIANVFQITVPMRGAQPVNAYFLFHTSQNMLTYVITNKSDLLVMKSKSLHTNSCSAQSVSPSFFPPPNPHIESQAAP